MAGLSDYDKAMLAKQLMDEMNSKEVDEKNLKVQRYSESTKTLYTDEEVAKKKISSYMPEKREEEKKELSIDDMFALLQEENKIKKQPELQRRGFAKIEEKEGTWHS